MHCGSAHVVVAIKVCHSEFVLILTVQIGNADIVLYGRHRDMPSVDNVGRKFLWAAPGGVLELHGKEKKSWTHLSDHLVRNGIAADDLIWEQHQQAQTMNGNRLVFHVLSAEGDLRDTFALDSGSNNFEDLSIWIDYYHNENNVFAFWTDFYYELTSNLDRVLSPFMDTSELSTILRDSSITKYTQIAGVFNEKGQSKFAAQRPVSSGFHSGLNTFVGPIDLEGEKSGFDFGIEIKSTWPSGMSKSEVDQIVRGQASNTFKQNFRQSVKYSSSQRGQAPIITVKDDISSWLVGDKIVIASTGFDARDSEVFTITQKIGKNQLKLDRPAEYTHWGRIDSRTGIDQRAEVGLLSRNVRFYGEMGSKCDYAFTRESLDSSSRMHLHNWCEYFADLEGEDRDMHGAHMIFTEGFDNVHVSHLEVFNAGQPRLARYPVHWHHASYVGMKGGYDDPSSAVSVSIHDSFSRFVTVHGTHEAIVKDNVGYNCHGHGFFMEDGYESENWITGNLGILVKPGIILPSDRHHSICKQTGDGWPNAENRWEHDRMCDGLSVFWISNMNNHIHDNAAVGGISGFWSFTHSANEFYQFDSIPVDPQSGKREWRNNKISASFHGFIMDETVKDDLPSQESPEPQFSINGQAWKVNMRSTNGVGPPPTSRPSTADTRPQFWEKPNGNWARLELSGWKVHHTMQKNYARNADIHLKNWQFSDNRQNYVVKATPQIFGAQKSLTDSVFVGMTRNTGHRYCSTSFSSPSAGHDFVDVASCGSQMDRVKPMDMANFPGRIKTAAEYTNNWFKPKGDVYRNYAADSLYPTQGLAITDTWTLQAIKNNRFYDFFSAEGDAYRNAIGVMYSNNFYISPKNCFIKDQSFINTPRHVQMGALDCETTDCAQNTIAAPFGDNFGSPARFRDLADGEKSMGYVDLDGAYNNGRASFVLAPTLLTMTTGCHNVGFAEGVSFPGLRVCPLDTPIAGVHFKYESFSRSPQDVGFQTEIEPVSDSEGPTVYNGNDSQTFMGVLRPYIEAYRTYTVKFKKSPPPGDIDMQLHDADHNTWYRLSVCVGSGTNVQDVQEVRRSLDNDANAISLDRRSAKRVTSWSELHSSIEGVTYFNDNGWVHLKVIQQEDRREGGTLHAGGASYEVGHTEDIVHNMVPARSMTTNYPSQWDFNMARGGHAAKILLDSRSLNGEQNCQSFNEPNVQREFYFF